MERGRNAMFTLLAGVLLLLVVLAAFLLIMLAPRSAGNPAKPQVGQLEALKCPVGSHAPVCYKVTVTNIGTAAGAIQCGLAPASDTTATFANNQITYTTPSEAPLPANESLTLVVITKPTPGNKTVSGSPSVACIPAT